MSLHHYVEAYVNARPEPRPGLDAGVYVTEFHVSLALPTRKSFGDIIFLRFLRWVNDGYQAVWCSGEMFCQSSNLTGRFMRYTDDLSHPFTVDYDEMRVPVAVLGERKPGSDVPYRVVVRCKLDPRLKATCFSTLDT